MKKNEKETQEKYVEFQILSNQFKQLQQQFVNLDTHILELTSLIDSLNKISGIKEDQDALVPIGSGIFLEGKIKAPKDTIITVGANVAVKKSIEDAKELVNRQLEEMKKLIVETEHQMEHLNEHLIGLKKEIESK